jgi:hypothetical protein
LGFLQAAKDSVAICISPNKKAGSGYFGWFSARMQIGAVLIMAR